MTRSNSIFALTLGLALILSSPALAAGKCPCNTVESGPLCVDQYEASMWKTTDPALIQKIKDGKICSSGELTAAGAVQVGISGIDYTDANCQFNGGGCKNIFAVSLPMVIPARSGHYFTYTAACRNSGKRLLTNAEWQAAALGTPDPWPQPPAQAADLCNVSGPGISLTGARVLCKSDVGAFDMVGNAIEWVADWGPLATTGTNWDIFEPGFGGDVSNIGGAPAGPLYGLPGGTIRGGSFAGGSGGSGQLAGVYAIDQNGAPNSIGDASASGFRCGMPLQ